MHPFWPLSWDDQRGHRCSFPVSHRGKCHAGLSRHAVQDGSGRCLFLLLMPALDFGLAQDTHDPHWLGPNSTTGHGRQCKTVNTDASGGDGGEEDG